MPFDPFFQSHKKKIYSAADHAQAERLAALPFDQSPYKTLKNKIYSREHLSPGEFLYVKTIDQKYNLKKAAAWHKNAKHYLGGNIIGGACNKGER